MGIPVSGVKWIKLVKEKYGIHFDSTLMLGRQYCSVIDQKKIVNQIRKIGRRSGSEDVIKINSIYQEDGYIENLLKWLGAKTIDSLDFSSYEGANIIHDMNKPIPKDLLSRYDVVIDGGTLEHIFNYPQGLKNAMDLVKKGGVLILFTPSNNYCGHGFYQLSPCVFMDILHKYNGYELLEISMVARNGFNHCKLKQISHYGTVYSSARELLYVIARRIGDVPREIQTQQGDYVETWNKENNSTEKYLAFREKLKSNEAISHAYYIYKSHCHNLGYNIDKELAKYL